MILNVVLGFRDAETVVAEPSKLDFQFTLRGRDIDCFVKR
jgi:hypothetical protein